MDWLADSLTALGSIVEIVGIAGLVLILATLLIGLAIYSNRKHGRPTKKEINSVVAPVTCKWTDADIYEAARDRERLTSMEATIKSMERDLIRISAMLSRYPPIDNTRD